MTDVTRNIIYQQKTETASKVIASNYRFPLLKSGKLLYRLFLYITDQKSDVIFLSTK